MKLFFVTGIANSNWSHIAEALQTPCQKVSENTFSKIKEANKVILRKGVATGATITDVILSLEDGSPSILVEEEILPSLDQWANSSEIRFLVFYCAPQIALASALQEQVLSNEECMDMLSSWVEQTRGAYDFYIKHKAQCLLLDVQDVVENQASAAKEMSTFLKVEATLNKASLNVGPEAKLTANLLMLEQDEAFELYDEIRSAAPLLGKLKLSGVEELSSFSEDALDIVRRKHAEQRENQKNIRTIKGSLTENLEKLHQQQADHATAVNISNNKISELTLAFSECQEQLALTTKQAAGDKQALQQKVDSLEQLLTKSKHALSDANKTQEKELVAKVAAQQELTIVKQAHDEASKRHEQNLADVQAQALAAKESQEQTTAEYEQKLTDLQALVIKAKEAQQNELAAKVLNQNELAKTKETLSETLEKQAELNKQNELGVISVENSLAEAKAENELFILQIAQLQEELECNHSESIASRDKFVEEVKQLQLKLQAQQQLVADLQEQHVTLIESEAKKLSEAITKNTELDSELKQNQSEQELLVLQLAQIQEELESLYQTNQTLNSRHEKHVADTAKYQELAAKLPALEAESEIAVLQINQLQEELEYYYLQLQEKDTKKMQNTPTIDRLTQDVFSKCHIESFDVVGSYETEGYADIQLVIHGVELADGRQFDSVSLKLIEVDGRPGLEFRPSEIENTNPPLSWREDMQDEYGAYIKFIPNPTESQANQQQKTNERLNASERVLILSVATALSDTLQQAHSAAGDLQNGKFRDWKLVALRLQQQIADLPAWLSFDAISLVEEMRSDNYEHLWLSFDNLLVNNHLYPNFKLKFAALGPLNEDSLFTDSLMLELREQDHGGAPLQAWPPAAHDEYGFNVQANIDLQGDELTLTVDEELSWHDKQFLRHLAKNLVNFIYALKQQDLIFERNIDDWISVANRVNELGQGEAKTIEPAEVTIDSALKFDFEEHVDLGGYQHLAYKTDIGEGQTLLLKLRAENINPLTQIADMAIELRTGDDNVPLAESIFFGEDEYGPRVLIALSELVSESFTQFELTEGGKIMQTFISSINQLIQSDSNLNTEQQALWMGLLTKEQ